MFCEVYSFVFMLVLWNFLLAHGYKWYTEVSGLLVQPGKLFLYCLEQ